MGELIFNSPGVQGQEIDMSGPVPAVPVGTPAGVIGTSRLGRAFIPITVPNYSEFVAKFGAVEKDDFGPMAMRQWFNNGAKAGLFMRLLGVGDAKRRTTTGGNAGKVNRAGFVAGEQIIQPDGQNGDNPYVGQKVAQPGQHLGLLGRAYILGCFMSESNKDSTIFRDAGIVEGVLTGSKPIIRGILFAPSGVALTLSSTYTPLNTALSQTSAPHTVVSSVFPDGTATATYTTAKFLASGTCRSAGSLVSPSNLCGGQPVGDVDVSAGGGDQFVMLLNGHKPARGAGNVITASFRWNGMADGIPGGANYFANVFNQDINKIEEKGHYLYLHYDVPSTFATVTGSNSTLSGAKDNKGKYSTPPANNVGGGGNLPKAPGVDIAFLLTASVARNSGTSGLTTTRAGIPNFDGFEDRYQAAFSPWVVSQDFGDGPQNLFRFYAVSDGRGDFQPQNNLEHPPERIKVSISNIRKSNKTTPGGQYGTFDVTLRDLWDNDKNIQKLGAVFTNCNLDPSSENYIARKVGDTHMYYDWDRDEGSQKLVIEGKYANKSNFVRVKISDAVEAGLDGMDPSALPVGFRGPWHMVTSGSGIFNVKWKKNKQIYAAAADGINSGSDQWRRSTSVVSKMTFQQTVQPPVPYRLGLWTLGADKITKTVDASYYWGVQTTMQAKPTDPNTSLVHNKSIDSFAKYLPMYHTLFQNVIVGDNAGQADKDGTVLDADLFNNNLFTLERVQVMTGSGGNQTLVNAGGIAQDLPMATEWSAARYRRDGSLKMLTSSNGQNFDMGRFLNVTKDFGDTSTQPYLKFSFFLQAPWNGTNLVEQDVATFTSQAARREMDNVATQGGKSGPVVAAYRKAIDILGERADADIQLLAIPGMRHPSVTDYAMDAMEDRFDAMYIMDIEEKDSANTFVTGSYPIWTKDQEEQKQQIDVGMTVRRFTDRNLDSSFAAAYFPDIILSQIDAAGNPVQVTAPPSVGVLGSYALNDTTGQPWFAPAGKSRGKMSGVKEVFTKLDKSNQDTCYKADLNPLVSFVGEGPLVYGQKTLLKAQSSLDRVNVRRLLIEVRRRVRTVANNILFEPNRGATLARFSAAVQPILNNIQQNQGLLKYKVQIDATTTTQADVENNTIRGKIFLQPTKTAEFIGLDFDIGRAHV